MIWIYMRDQQVPRWDSDAQADAVGSNANDAQRHTTLQQKSETSRHDEQACFDGKKVAARRNQQA